MSDHFEAKKHAYRQTQDGIVVSFVVHPNDVSAALAMAPLGTRYMVGFAEIGDNEQPSPPVRAEVPVDPRGALGAAKPPVPPVVPAKDRRPFNSLPLPQQAALRCGDDNFRAFLSEEYGGGEWTPEQAAQEVRNYCGVTSRALIVEGDKAGDFWLKLEGEYQDWLTTRQYAESRR
jgi:hypothetical protein